MRKLSTILFLCICSLNLFGQKKITQEIEALLSNNNIQLVDSASFFEKVLPRTNKPKIVFIYTNLCSGTQGIFDITIPNVKSKFDDNVDFILISSESVKKINSLISLLQENNYTNNLTYIIDPSKFKESWKDSRIKGFDFRNTVCEPCKKDIIGVPYKIIYDSKGNYLSSGYLSANECIAIIENSL